MMRIHRVLTVLLCLLAAVGVLAQAPAAGSNWQRVQQLPLHTKVHVSADSKGRVCTIDSVTDELLTCTSGHVVGSSHYTFQRAEIKSIKVTRYTLSALAGAGIGAGVGAGIGAGVGASGDGFFTKSQAAGVCAAIGVIPGALVGWGTDFAKGPTVYRRP
jgi:hypothetical protein